MGVYTDYDEKRDRLREHLNDCLEQARELLDTNIWGYDEMRIDYAIDVYMAIKNVVDEI